MGAWEVSQDWLGGRSVREMGCIVLHACFKQQTSVYQKIEFRFVVILVLIFACHSRDRMTRSAAISVIKAAEDIVSLPWDSECICRPVIHALNECSVEIEADFLYVESVH